MRRTLKLGHDLRLKFLRVVKVITSPDWRRLASTSSEMFSTPWLAPTGRKFDQKLSGWVLRVITSPDATQLNKTVLSSWVASGYVITALEVTDINQTYLFLKLEYQGFPTTPVLSQLFERPTVHQRDGRTELVWHRSISVAKCNTRSGYRLKTATRVRPNTVGIASYKNIHIAMVADLRGR